MYLLTRDEITNKRIKAKKTRLMWQWHLWRNSKRKRADILQSVTRANAIRQRNYTQCYDYLSSFDDITRINLLCKLSLSLCNYLWKCLFEIYTKITKIFLFISHKFNIICRHWYNFNVQTSKLNICPVFPRQNWLQRLAWIKHFWLIDPGPFRSKLMGKLSYRCF